MPHLTRVGDVSELHFRCFLVIPADESDAELDHVIIATVGCGRKCDALLEVRLHRIVGSLPQQQERFLTVDVTTWTSLQLLCKKKEKIT